jgi:hypothetical protein
MSKKRRFENIREAIRQQEQLSRAARAKIRETSGLDRYEAWTEKRSVGAHTRDLLLAYAFLRGMPYRVCEPITRNPEPPPVGEPVKNGPPAYGVDIFWRLVEFGYREKPERLGKCPEDLQAWLAAPALEAGVRGAA